MTRRTQLLFAPSAVLILVGLLGMAWFLVFPPPRPPGPLDRIIFSADRALLMAAERGGDDTRFLTVLIPYDHSRFFIQNGEPRGFEYELVRAFERELNAKRKRGEPELQAIFVPTRLGDLVPRLASGIGDIAAGGLTITPERAALVDFSRPYFEDVAELVVAHKASPKLERVEDLAGKRVVVLSGSSYVGSLEALNHRFAAEGLAPVEIVEAAPELNTEDLIEMTYAGIIAYTIADQHIAELWQGVLDGIRVDPEIAIVGGGEIAWAIRQDAPESLKEAMNAFLETVRRGTLTGNILFRRYFENRHYVENPLNQTPLDDLVRYRDLFEAEAEAHDFDWRLIAAVAFQESRLNPDARSPRGAVGLMQVLPSTAASVGIDDPAPVDNNIAAGVRYLAHLRDDVFADPNLDDQVREQFMLAAYNAGPTRVRQLRAVTADELGLDPDRWFFNVERAAQARIGNETVRYVTNVNKYWLAYQLGEAILAERQKERGAVN
jgi:membrane-bound lytic murein transglycosylase MltF